MEPPKKPTFLNMDGYFSFYMVFILSKLLNLDNEDAYGEEVKALVQ